MIVLEKTGAFDADLMHAINANFQEVANLPSTLAGLTDVDLGVLVNLQVLTYDAGTGKWVNGAGGNGNPFDQSLNIADLSQFAGLGIGTPGVATRFDLIGGGSQASVTTGGFEINDGVNYASLSPVQLSLGFVTLDNLGVAAGISSITRDGGDLTISTTTSGKGLFNFASGAEFSAALSVVAADQPADKLILSGGFGAFSLAVDNSGSSTDYSLGLQAAGATGAIALLTGGSQFFLFGADGSLTVPAGVSASGYTGQSLTWDSGDLTISTTTSGDIALEPASGVIRANGSIQGTDAQGGLSMSSGGDGLTTALTLTAATTVSISAGGDYLALDAQFGTMYLNTPQAVFSGSVSASGYLVGANPGTTGTVTTASLVGMTMNFENGIYMGLT